MDYQEAVKGQTFTLAIAHHTFLNPLIMSDVLRERHRLGSLVSLWCVSFMALP